MLETLGSGAAFFDYDTDVTQKAELGFPMPGLAVTVGDYDNDSYLDLIVSNAQTQPEFLFHKCLWAYIIQSSATELQLEMKL